LKDVEPFVPEEFGSRNRNTLYTKRSPDDTEKPRLHNEQIKHETYRYIGLEVKSEVRIILNTIVNLEVKTSHKRTRSRIRNQSRIPVKTSHSYKPTEIYGSKKYLHSAGRNTQQASYPQEIY
jgi:hypothetical protein